MQDVSQLTADEIAKYIDHTQLKPEATPAQIDELCAEAREYGFIAVCVNPSYVRRAAEQLEGSHVRVATVAGFPLGATLTQVKVYETEQALLDGAQEVDMVINVGALKAGDDQRVQEDIAAVSRAAHRGGALCKVILETALLNQEEKVRACRLAQAAGADFVKTSTGFSSAGATVDDVQLMRETVGPDMGVKAAGGVRNLEQAKAMIAAGATRIGASAGVKIVQEARG